MWDLWWTEAHWGGYSPSASVSLATHSTDSSTAITIYHPGMIQQTINGRSNSGLGSTPAPLINKKLQKIPTRSCKFTTEKSLHKNLRYLNRYVGKASLEKRKPPQINKLRYEIIRRSTGNSKSNTLPAC
jgi:hypothetical protein